MIIITICIHMFIRAPMRYLYQKLIAIGKKKTKRRKLKLIISDYR